jgi:hypothetical protein
MRPSCGFRGWLGTTITLAGYARTGLFHADISAPYLAATGSDWPFFKRVSPDCLAERVL